MENLIIIGIIALILGLAIGYVVKEKKNGRKCIGCPSGGACSARGGESGCGSCSGHCGGAVK